MGALGYTQQAFTQRSSYTERLLHSEAFTHSKLSHRESFTHRSFYTLQTFTQSQLLHRASSYTKLGKFLFTESFYTEQTFTQRNQAELRNTIELSRRTLENEAWTGNSTARPIRPWSRFKRACSAPVCWTSFPVHLPRHVFSCKTRHFVHPLAFKNAVRARLSRFPSKSIQKWKVKMWKQSFRGRLPSTSESGRCQNKAFVQDFPQHLRVEDVKTKLSCETSLKIWKWKMWKRSFRVRLPSTSESGRCENKALLRDFPQNLKVEDVKTKLSCETSPKKVKLEDVKTELSCETCDSGDIVIVVILW